MTMRTQSAVLAVIITFSFVVALCGVFLASIGEGISAENRDRALDEVPTYYLPVVSAVVAFFATKQAQTRKRRAGAGASQTGFMVVGTIITLWALLPIGVYFVQGVIEDSIELMERFRTFFTPLVMGPVGIYFAVEPGERGDA